jgi:hypothetical protein
MPKANKPQQEGQILLAIQAFNSGQFKSLKAAALSYGIPSSTVSDRYHGRQPRRVVQPNRQKLTDLQEEVLVRHIIDLDTRGFPPRMSIVQETANLLLASHKTTPPETVGKNWVTNFIQRYDKLCTLMIGSTITSEHNARIQKLYKTGLLSYEINLRNTVSLRKTSTTLMSLGFKWV